MKLGITQYSKSETDWAQFQFCIWDESGHTFRNRNGDFTRYTYMTVNKDFYGLCRYVSFVWRTV